jgi:hypothetical protein
MLRAVYYRNRQAAAHQRFRATKSSCSQVIIKIASRRDRCVSCTNDAVAFAIIGSVSLENTMKRLILAATVAVIGLCYTTSLQAQTSTQTTKSAAKNKKIKNIEAQPKSAAKSVHCDQSSGANHNTACY